MHTITGTAGATRSLRRLTLSLLAALALAAGLVSSPAHAAEPDTRGLFGTQNPTYDGVYRQAMAILGLTAVRAPVPAPAIEWLLSQQCADGSFASYRPDPAQPCPAADPGNYTGPDTNSTALAVMALNSLKPGKARPQAVIQRAAKRAAAWLTAQQQVDGGWQWIDGLGADSISTGMSLAAIGRRGTPDFRAGAAWLGTTMDTAGACGVSFTAGGIVDPLSTSWALIAAQGSLPYAPRRGPRELAPCSGPRPGIAAAGTWLADALIAGQGRIASAYTPDETDWNSTALATLGMSQSRGSTQAMRLGVTALQANVLAYTRTSSGDMPGALGTLLLVAHATGADPADFGGVDLRRQLLASMQK
jgi:hypothetical protein